MPVYKGERFVAAAIESVLAQTYQAFELVIVNDGSPDGSAKEINYFLPHPKIRYVEQDNHGVAGARNVGIAKGTGDLIALLDQDDVWLPEKLKRQTDYLAVHPNVGLLHSRAECIDARGKPRPCTDALWVHPFEGMCASQLLLGNGIAPLTVVLRRSCVDDVGAFDPSFAPADDWELWIRIARRHPVGFLDEVTARYRVHDQNISHDQLKMQRAVLKIIDSISDRFPDVLFGVSAEQVAVARSNALRGVAKTLEQHGKRIESRRHWREVSRTSHDLEASLALYGMPASQRKRVERWLAGSPRLERIIAWYLYRAATIIWHVPKPSARSAQTAYMLAKAQGALAILNASVSVAMGRIAHHWIFAHLDDDVWFSVNTTAYRRFSILRKVLPSMPDDSIQRDFIGSEGDRALQEGFRAYQIICKTSSLYGRPVTQESAILDFGCGWGRILRFFMRDVPTAQLHGVDVMPLAIDLSRQTNPWCKFSLISALPPSGLTERSYDLIYLYSVFSHLSEHAHQRWLTEFHRLLRPGGLLFATTRPRYYIERCERARHGDTMGTNSGTVLSFIGTEAWLLRYDQGDYCHSPIGGGGVLSTDFYGETCIPEAYVRRHWADRFDVKDYMHADGEWLLQDLIVAQKR
jgi:glycosyltransferase involved in cell wall biosynthesis/2-polyprenyl-3-methyl-5-hydroxy-6-metoxy-1,4-benzoquinol methylase